jgi:hypothetical protein
MHVLQPFFTSSLYKGCKKKKPKKNGEYGPYQYVRTYSGSILLCWLAPYLCGGVYVPLGIKKLKN